MTNILVPFSLSEQFDGDCLLTGEFIVPAEKTAEEVREAAAKYYLDSNATYEEFLDEYCTSVDGAWLIKKHDYDRLINCLPICGNDSAVYASIRQFKNGIASFAISQVIF